MTQLRNGLSEADQNEDTMSVQRPSCLCDGDGDSERNILAVQNLAVRIPARAV